MKKEKASFFNEAFFVSVLNKITLRQYQPILHQKVE